MAPSTFRQWVLRTPERSEAFEALHLSSAPMASVLGDYDVLVNMKAASLNYRDIIIARGGNPFHIKEGVVPGSDGAGVVVRMGAKVREFCTGDRVMTTLMRDHVVGPLTQDAVLSSLGAVVDGVLAEYGVYPEHGLVKIADHLRMLEASTLSCAGLTAWTSLYGGRDLKPGDVVVTQGTGGVSLFALQLAVAAGATVIATTSTKEKGTYLKKIGATHVVNYKEVPNWGETVRNLTKDGTGVDLVIEVGGGNSFRQSLKAAKMGGIISLVGSLESSDILDPPLSTMELFASQSTIRSIGAGNRQDLMSLMRFVDERHIKPVIDSRVFSMHGVREAYQYLSEQNHIGKVVIDLST